MQPQQSSRIDVADLKVQIVKKIGADRARRYFYYLNRLLSQKLCKSEFDKLCSRVLGRENVLLHNQFIRSILKNAFHAKTPPPFHAKTPPPFHDAGPTNSVEEDGHEQSRAVIANPTPNSPIWSNGAVPSWKSRPVIRDRKPRDRPSPLGPNGKVDYGPQWAPVEDSGSKVLTENGELTPCDYQRPVQPLQGVAELPENQRQVSVQRPKGTPRHSQDHTGLAVVEDGEEVEQASHLKFSRSRLIAPLGIPFCSASIGGARKALSVPSNDNMVSYFDSGGLFDTEILRKRMEQIAGGQGLGGVSMECANMLNNMLDVYLKRLIKSCVELVGARSKNEPKKHHPVKQSIQSKIVNGMWPSNHLHMQSSSGPIEVIQEQRPLCSISLLDFKVAMELNPQQLGEDWPLLLEKICMQTFEE